MKATFVNFSQNFFDKLSVYPLAAQLKKYSIDLGYININNFRNAIRCLEKTRPHIVLYSAFSKDISIYVRFDKILKETLHYQIKSIIGGAGATYDSELLAKSTIDFLCVGEAEYALPEFLTNGFVPHKNIIAMGDKYPTEFYPFADLNELPFEDRGLVYDEDKVLRNMAAKQFLSGRGCPYRCTYCHNHVFNERFKSCGPIVRQKKVDYIIEEINQVKASYPLRRGVFYDDTFILNKKWLREFCERFPKEVGIEYTCQIRANLIDEEIVSLLKESRCVLVTWSIESGNDYTRNKILKRNMSTDDILNTGRLLAKYKIPSRIGNVIGTPGESFDNIMETLELNIESRPQLAMAWTFVPYPGLSLTDYALKNGFLNAGHPDDLPANYLRSILNFSKEEKKRIANLTFLFPAMVKHPNLLYRKKKVFYFLMSLPPWMLRIFWEVYYSYQAYRLVFSVKQPFVFKFRLLLRHLGNIYHYIVRF